MAAGPVLIWEMVHVRLGVLLLHSGLLAGGLLLWRDPAVGACRDGARPFVQEARGRCRE